MTFPPGGGYLKTAESALYQLGGMGIESALTVVAHTEHEKPVGIATLHIVKIVILKTVNELLRHNGGRHLGVVHVGEEYLGGVPAVNEPGGKHLHLFSEEHGTALTGGVDGLTVYYGVLTEP